MASRWVYPRSEKQMAFPLMGWPKVYLPRVRLKVYPHLGKLREFPRSEKLRAYLLMERLKLNDLGLLREYLPRDWHLASPRTIPARPEHIVLCLTAMHWASQTENQTASQKATRWVCPLKGWRWAYPLTVMRWANGWASCLAYPLMGWPKANGWHCG